MAMVVSGGLWFFLKRIVFKKKNATTQFIPSLIHGSCCSYGGTVPTAGLHGGGDVMISEYRKVTKALLLNDCMFIFNFLKYFTCHHHRHHACHAYLYSRNKVSFL